MDNPETIEDRRLRRLREAREVAEDIERERYGNVASSLGGRVIRTKHMGEPLEVNQRDLGGGASQRIRMPGAE